MARAAGARAALKKMYEPDTRPDRGPGRDPAAAAPPDAHGAYSGDEPAAAADEFARAAGCLRVLVVDDAPDVTELLALLMSHAGYEVATAFSAPEAFDAARAGHFDAVISDIGMPGMNGYQLAEALRALPGYESTPLIAVTGFTHLEDRERARRAGFDDFLPKPINPSDLLDAVRKLCG
ncbi:MAG TPA: response regulator [Pyrinomonadaceae bacterium]